jgi:hypothetical protein
MRTWVRYAVIVTVLPLTLITFYALWADDEHHGNAHSHRGKLDDDVDEKGGQNHEKRLKHVTNGIYNETCGACHFAYQPGLLPSGSWAKVLSNLKDHFGETVDIDAASKEVIEKYLTDNAAEKSQWKRSRKILRSLKGETPLRITQVPYIIHKHQDIRPEVLTRDTVRSLSNCSACHRSAAQGIYDDDDAVIPK